MENLNVTYRRELAAFAKAQAQANKTRKTVVVRIKGKIAGKVYPQ